MSNEAWDACILAILSFGGKSHPATAVVLQ